MLFMCFFKTFFLDSLIWQILQKKIPFLIVFVSFVRKKLPFEDFTLCFSSTCLLKELLSWKVLLHKLQELCSSFFLLESWILTCFVKCFFLRNIFWHSAHEKKIWCHFFHNLLVGDSLVAHWFVDLQCFVDFHFYDG